MKFFEGKLWLALFGPFAVEYFFLRIWVKHFAKLRIGFPSITDYDFLPQLAIAGFVFCSVVCKRSSFQVGFQPKMAFWHLTLLLGLLCFSLWLPPHLDGSIWLRWCWYGLAAGVFSTAIFLMVPGAAFFRADTRALSILLLLAVFSKPLLLLLAEFLWMPMTHLSGNMVFLLWTFLGSPLQIDYVPEAVRLLHPRHCLFIGRGCSGLDGLALMVFLVAIVNLRSNVKFDPLFFIFSLAIGSAWMLVLNVSRVSFFLLGAIAAQRQWGESEFTWQITRVLLHNGMTWLVYGMGLLLFVALIPALQRGFSNARVLLNQLLQRQLEA